MKLRLWICFLKHFRHLFPRLNSDFISLLNFLRRLCSVLEVHYLASYLSDYKRTCSRYRNPLLSVNSRLNPSCVSSFSSCTTLLSFQQFLSLVGKTVFLSRMFRIFRINWFHQIQPCGWIQVKFQKITFVLQSYYTHNLFGRKRLFPNCGQHFLDL